MALDPINYKENEVNEMINEVICPRQAIVDLILYYDWKSVIYIYQSSEHQNLKLKQILN